MQTLGEMIRVLGERGGPRPETPRAEAVALETTVTEPGPPAQIETPATADTVEILHSQYPFLVSHWAVSTCSLCSRVRLQGPFDTAAAQRTWQGLLDRHPALRARFSYPPEARSFKDYRMEVLKTPAAPAIAVHDLRSLPPADQAEAIVIEMRRCVSHEWALDQWPLHRFFSWRLADDVHELFFTNHQLVADGLSNQQIVREFVELYRADVTGDVARLPAPTTVQRYQEVAAAINAWDDPEASRALAEFLHRQGKEAFFWNPLKRPRESTARIQAEHARIQLDPKTTGALLRRVGEWRLPMNSLLVGAFLRAVGNLDPTLEQVIINVPTSGRLYPGIDASGIVGCFAQNLALSFTLPAADETWLPFLHRVHVEIEAAIAAGYDRAQTREAALAARERLPLVQGRIAGPVSQMIRASLKSNLFLPYVGQTRIESRYGPMSVLDYQAATITNAGTIDTLVEIFHEQLMMTVNYDAKLHSRELINRVSGTFLSELRHLADCQDTFGVAARRERDWPDHGLVATQLRQVAEEVLHLPITVQDMNRDLESELGVDSLERIRIITRIQSFFGPVDRRALFAARSLNEVIASLAGRSAETAAAERSASLPSVVMPATATVDTPIAEQGEIPLLRIIEQCRRSPQAIAVECGQERLSYQELHRCSNRLAHCLRAQGVGRGALVGIMLDRGPRLLIAILGTLKAGAAYVPLDPDYPSERIGYMLGHARLSTVLTEQRQAEALAKCVSASGISPTVIQLDDGYGLPPTTAGRWLAASEWQAFPGSDPVVVNAPDDLMVVLYTSGSTGKPKGVMLAHRGYANRLGWMQSLLGLRSGERVAQKTSVCFDVSVWELLWPLMVGGTVCPVATDIVRDPWALSEWVRNARINVMHFVPSLFGEFLSAACEPITSFADLRSLVFSGEALPAAHIQRWMDRFGTRVGLVNLYGPTEASIDVTAHVIRDRPGSANARIPIGQAMPNVHLRILDAEMRPLPPEKVGELWIGGIQLAHGYLHDPDRTHDAFKANPFGDVPGATLYRTGDLAAQLPDGSFDYHGRIDSQVKIRGFRVELGEVEAALSACSGVSEAAVLAIEYAAGQKRLIAALVGETAEPKALRGHLARTLPDYMIPHRFVWLPRLPKNQNGKLDRGALHQVLTERTHVSEENRVVADDDRPVLAARDYPLGLDLFESLLRDANENVPKAAEAEVVDLEIRRTAGRGRSLSGKVAIVTGAGRGIGRAIARAFACEGARVALISRSPAQLEEAVAEVRAIHPEAVGIAADVTSEDEVRHAVDEVLARFGAIDILVNNAGINFSSLLVESDPAEWRSIIDVNVLGTYHCCRAVLPHLQTRRTGKIVNLGSAASVIGYPLFSAYSAAKHAVLGMTKALAEEVKQANIQVNAVCPSFVDTRMTPAAFRGNAIATREVAEIVLFLCSPQSDCITGESINVFGKQDMYSYGSERMSLIQSITKDSGRGSDSE